MDNAIIATNDDEEDHTQKVHHFLDKLLTHDLYLNRKNATSTNKR